MMRWWWFRYFAHDIRYISFWSWLMMMILKFVFSDGSTEHTPRRRTCDIDRCCVWWPANQCGLQPHFKIDLWVSTCEAWTTSEAWTKKMHPTKLLIRYLTHGLAAVWCSQSELLASSSNFLVAEIFMKDQTRIETFGYFGFPHCIWARSWVLSSSSRPQILLTRVNYFMFYYSGYSYIIRY